jgi:hypothetical protein
MWFGVSWDCNEILMCASECQWVTVRASEWQCVPVSDSEWQCASEWQWVTVAHITDQFEEHNFDWYKNSLMMAFKKCRNM